MTVVDLIGLEVNSPLLKLLSDIPDAGNPDRNGEQRPSLSFICPNQ
jgi:hypothetical protein